jgi:hypothetical protein
MIAQIKCKKEDISKQQLVNYEELSYTIYITIYCDLY